MVQSAAEDLVPVDDDADDVFVRDMVTGTTTRISVDAAGGDAEGGSTNPAINATGRYIAFESVASDLVADDGNGRPDVFVRDMVTGTTTRVSVDGAGGDANGDVAHLVSASVATSPSARCCADIVAGDGYPIQDVFVRDMATGTTTRVSVDTTGGDPDSDSLYPAISASGRYIAFQSFARDLVADDGNRTWDVFVRDVVAGTTTRVSVDGHGEDAHGESQIRGGAEHQCQRQVRHVFVGRRGPRERRRQRRNGCVRA